jgi:hypothetical protein
MQSTTDVSQFEVGLLEKEWKAAHAVRDDKPLQKLCETLKDILGDTLLAAGSENYLLARFSSRLQVGEEGNEGEMWSNNPSEPQASVSTDPRRATIRADS